MSRFRISRRHLLKGAGSIAIGLPWLEAMVSHEAKAQSATAAKRFIAVYQPGGTVLDKWRPTGSETDFALSPILEPFAEVKDHLLVVDGVDMQSAVGEQHEAGIVALLTGTPQSAANSRYAAGPSIDQVIAGLATNGRARESVEIAVRSATGKSHGDSHPINSVNFAADGRASPLSPRIDPVQVWDALFGNIEPSDPDATAEMLARKQSILDFVGRRYEGLSQRLGAGDRAKLEAHLDEVRGL